jgi:antitoxin (DNA-binding transcriptional repressor) of toxin-antitoxin stability system
VTVTSIGAAKFKEQCLALLENLSPEGLVITKHGKPVALVTPYPKESSDLIGCLRDKIEVHGDLLSTGISWNADAQP